MKSYFRCCTFYLGVLFLSQVFASLAQPGNAQQQGNAPQQPPQQSTTGQAAAPQQAPAQPASTPGASPQSANPVNNGGGISLEAFYWVTSGAPQLRSGTLFTGTNSGNFDYPGKPKRTPGAILSFPAGKGSTLRFSYFRVQGNGNTATSVPLSLLGTDFVAGDSLVTTYKVQNIKVSWDYLTYFFKVGKSDFRLKTLWEFQYASIKNSIDAPFDPNASIVTPVTASATRSAYLPTLGLGLESTLSRHFRWEAKGSGFALPHRSAIWDAEGNIAFRFGKIEIIAGEKAYFFKTSPKKDEFLKMMLSGAYGGLRWYF